MENVSQNAYKEESARLQSFANWPKTDVVAPEVLASDGFIYLGTGDMVQCIFCNGKLRAWEPGCIPREDHERYFPQCPYVLGYDVGNVASRRDYRRNQSLGVYNPGASSTSGWSSSGSAATAEAAVATSRIKAVTPQMAPRSVRQASFTSWPLHSTQASFVSELADAGFYYSGVGDQMKCFCCDGCLENWTAGDNVWREHAKHFPQCEFLTIAKGPEYVADIQSTLGEQGATAGAATGPKPVKLYHVDPREVRARLDTPRVRNMLSVGYTVTELTVAIEQQLRTKGSDFATLPEFIAALESVRAKNKDSASASSSLPQPTPSAGATSATASASRNTLRASAASAGGDSASADAGNAKHKKKKKKQSVQALTEQQAAEAEVRAAIDEYRQLREARQCKVCLDEDIAVVFLPCGHACTCTGCAATVSHCPICRHFIRGTVKIAA